MTPHFPPGSSVLGPPASSPTFFGGPQRQKERGRDGPQPQLPEVDTRAPERPAGVGAALLGAGAGVLAPSPAEHSPSRPRPVHSDPRGRASRPGRGEKAGGPGRGDRSQLPFLTETESRGVYKGQCPSCGRGCGTVCDGGGAERPTTVPSPRPQERAPVQMDGAPTAAAAGLSPPRPAPSPSGRGAPR